MGFTLRFINIRNIYDLNSIYCYKKIVMEKNKFILKELRSIVKQTIREYGEDSGGQDMSYGIYNRSLQKKDGGNFDFIKKGEDDYYDGVPFDACPYGDGINKHYKIDLSEYWKHGWLNAKNDESDD